MFLPLQFELYSANFSPEFGIRRSLGTRGEKCASSLFFLENWDLLSDEMIAIRDIKANYFISVA